MTNLFVTNFKQTIALQPPAKSMTKTQHKDNQTAECNSRRIPAYPLTSH
jgi:hypothetical protein